MCIKLHLVLACPLRRSKAHRAFIMQRCNRQESEAHQWRAYLRYSCSPMIGCVLYKTDWNVFGAASGSQVYSPRPLKRARNRLSRRSVAPLELQQEPLLGRSISGQCQLFGSHRALAAGNVRVGVRDDCVSFPPWSLA